LKRALLTASFAAALAVALIVALFVVRSRDAAAVSPAARTARVTEPESTSGPGDVEPSAVASDASERTESRVEDPEPALNRWGLGDGGPLAHFRGRLVYESTGQGVPWCAVGLRGVGRQVEFCTTDDDGRFHSRLAYPLARTLVLVNGEGTQSTDWENAVEVHREDGEAELTVKVQPAPTLVLAGELPSGLEPSTLTGSIRSSDDFFYLYLRVRAGGEYWFAREELPRPPDLERAHTNHIALVEEMKRDLAKRGDSRLSQDAKSHVDEVGLELPIPDIASMDADTQRLAEQLKSAHGPWTVQLESEHKSWTGTAVLDQFEGVIQLEPQWDSLGAVALAFHGNWKTPPAWTIRADLRSGLADSNRNSQSGRLDQLAEKPLRFSGITPGAYTLVIDSDMCDRVEFPIVVGGPEPMNVDVQLNCAVSAGSIRGEITSESGEEPKEKLFFNLWRPGLMSYGDIKLERDATFEKWKKTFEIADVPAGEFNLTCYFGGLGIEPLNTVNVRAGDFVHLRVLDRPTYVDIGFRVFDAESGAELETFDIDFPSRETDKQSRGLRSGAIVVEHFPENGQLRWRVTSPGHVCEETDFMHATVWGLSTGTKRWIDVRLARGWRIKCAVFDDDDYHTLKDATIVADGVDMGTTDADGYFTLTLPQRPKRIEARYRDWRCIESDTNGLETMQSCDEVGFVFERKH
jgi:hypothetical protein